MQRNQIPSYFGPHDWFSFRMFKLQGASIAATFRTSHGNSLCPYETSAHRPVRLEQFLARPIPSRIRGLKWRGKAKLRLTPSISAAPHVGLDASSTLCKHAFLSRPLTALRRGPLGHPYPVLAANVGRAKRFPRLKRASVSH